MHPKVFLVALLLTIVAWHSVGGQFIYIHGAAFKLVTGLGIPIDVNLPGGGLSWFSNIQAIYELPDNVTYFEPYKVMQKRSVKNTFNRPTVYKALEKYFDGLGVYGSECIQKLICEVARRGTEGRLNGLFGDFLQILFSPYNDPHSGLADHKKAHIQGLYNETDCHLIYPDCEVSENSILSS